MRHSLAKLSLFSDFSAMCFACCIICNSAAVHSVITRGVIRPSGQQYAAPPIRLTYRVFGLNLTVDVFFVKSNISR